MTKPISPAEALALQPKTIPPVVYEVVNTILAQHAAAGSISFTQDRLIDLILEAAPHAGLMNLTRQELFANCWLDIEEAYEAAGWKVEYDKPGYNEDYKARFTFSA